MRIFYVIILLLCVQMATAGFIVINETEKDFYSLETVKLTGDMDTNLLKIAGNGNIISGTDVKVYLFGPSQDFVITGAVVNGISASVSFDSSGYFLVIKDLGQFSFTADMQLRKVGQLQLFVPGPINELAFSLEHGYSVSGDEYGVSQRQVTIQRSEKAAMLVDSSFRYSFAETDTFYYSIGFKSFGSALGQYTVGLPNGEKVQSVSGALRWQQVGSSLVLELGGSQATVTATGIFSSTALSMPVKEGTIHVLIESDAEKKLSVSTDAKEIDISESPVSPIYSNSRSFIAEPYSTFQISIKDLQILPSLAASVSSATNSIAITDKGSVLGELQYSYANTGVDYIEIDAPGTPLYASTQSGPVKLTKDSKFMLAFPKTSYGSLDFLYFTTIEMPLLAGIIDVPLASTTLPITQQSTSIYLTDDYYALEIIGADGGSELPSFPVMLVFIIIVGGLAFMFRKDIWFAILYTASAAGLWLFSWQLCLIALAVTLFVVIKNAAAGKPWWKWILIGAGALILLSVVVTLILTLFTARVGSMSKSYEVNAMDSDGMAAPQRSLEKIGTGSGAVSVPVRTGVLPVKLVLPHLSRQITVRHDLVTIENPVRLRLVLVSSYFIWVIYLLAALAGFLAYRRHASVDHK